MVVMTILGGVFSSDGGVFGSDGGSSQCFMCTKPWAVPFT